MLSSSSKNLKKERVCKDTENTSNYIGRKHNIIFSVIILIILLVSLRYLNRICFVKNNEMKLISIMQTFMIIEVLIIMSLVLLCSYISKRMKGFNRLVGINNSIVTFCLSFYYMISIKITHNQSYIHFPLLINAIIQLLLIYKNVLSFMDMLYICLGVNCFIANFIVPILLQTNCFSNAVYLFYCFLWIILLLSYGLEKQNTKRLQRGYLLRKSKERDERIISLETTGILMLENEVIVSLNMVMYNIIINDNEILMIISKKHVITPWNIIKILNENINIFLYQLIGKDLIFEHNNEKSLIRLLNYFQTEYLCKCNNDLQTFKYHSTIDNKHFGKSYRIMYKYSSNKNKYTFVFYDDSNKINKKLPAKFDKSMFFSHIAKEFKEPLVEIQNNIDHLSQYNNSLSTKLPSINLDLIKSFTLYLYTLANDMECYDIFKEHKAIQLYLTLVNIDDTINFTKQIANGLIARQNTLIPLIFEVIIDKVIPKIIYTDQMRLRQILINLISNSIKFTDKGSVVLHLSEEDDALKFSVRDTGRGLTHSQQKGIFQPFEKSTSQRNINGAGLGLCIVKELSFGIGEEIQFTSILNHGSTFWFKIPLMNDENAFITNKEEYDIYKSRLQSNHKSTSSITKTSPSYVEKHLIERPDNSSENTIITPLQSLCLNCNKNKEEVEFEIKLEEKIILLADDQDHSRELTMITINDYAKKNNISIKTIETRDGYEVIDYICKNSTNGIDLILCNDNMKYCQGSECHTILSKLVNENKLNYIPFALLTASLLISPIQIYNPILPTYLKPLNETTLHTLITNPSH